jgi:uncharacterized integral membrane protein
VVRGRCFIFIFNWHFTFSILHFLMKFTRGLHPLVVEGRMTKTVHCTGYTVYTMTWMVVFTPALCTLYIRIFVSQPCKFDTFCVTSPFPIRIVALYAVHTVWLCVSTVQTVRRCLPCLLDRPPKMI